MERAFFDSARSSMQERQLGQIYLLLAAAETDASGTISMPETLAESRFSTPGSGLYAEITAANQTIAWRSSSVLGQEPPFPGMLKPGAQNFQQRQDKAGKIFFVYSLGINWATKSGDFPFTFHVAEDLTAFQAQISKYRHSLWAWFGAMAVLLLLTMLIVLRWGLAPLRQLTSELSLIESGKQERIEGAYPQELHKLTGSLNTLMHHERTQQKRYRNALADLAHSLKTPLAILRGMIGEKKSKPLLTQAVEEQVERMDQIVMYQLQRAATAGPSTLAKPIAVRAAAQRIMDALKKAHRDKSVQTQLEVEDGICFQGDEGDLLELLGNLVENAFKWCSSQVSLRAELNGKYILLILEDDGPGIDAGQAEKILQRGVRADQSVPGHGIGLAIVQDIIQTYDGSIRIEQNRSGGAKLILELPGYQK
ncbi:MAG: ATP-binding protein [Mariprofundaceae bacterium]